MALSEELLRVEDLRVYFSTERGLVRAVDGVGFVLPKGATYALVGESGCGKSVTALALARLVDEPPGYYAGGRVLLRGRNVLEMEEGELRRLRGNEISYVFQEPAVSLNPVFRIGYQLAEAIRLHRRGVNVREEVLALLKMVGLPDAESKMKEYPHRLSGGMQQRVMIAMALACRPAVLVADEPTTALDVTIQAQILELLARLQRELGMAVLLITHNLGLVADLAERLLVMYAGRIVEAGPTLDLLRGPRHPYTRGLLAAVPRLRSVGGEVRGIRGSVPNPLRLPEGCKFHPRCPFASDICRRVEPEDEWDGERVVRCHRWREI